MTTMQFCRKCGCSVGAAASFCRRCGSKAFAATQHRTAIQTNGATARDAREDTRKELPPELKEGGFFSIQCTGCEKQFAKRSVFSPHGGNWMVRGANALCARCVRTRLRGGQRIIDRGSDWASPGTLLLMVLAIGVLGEFVLLAAGYVFIPGIIGLVIAFFIVRALATSFGPHGEFVPANEMPPLEYDRAIELVRQGVRTGASPLGIAASLEGRDVVAGRSEVGALAVIAAAEERGGKDRRPEPNSTRDQGEILTPMS